jgi:hypothetical protein
MVDRVIMVDGTGAGITIGEVQKSNAPARCRAEQEFLRTTFDEPVEFRR